MPAFFETMPQLAPIPLRGAPAGLDCYQGSCTPRTKPGGQEHRSSLPPACQERSHRAHRTTSSPSIKLYLLGRPLHAFHGVAGRACMRSVIAVGASIQGGAALTEGMQTLLG